MLGKLKSAMAIFRGRKNSKLKGYLDSGRVTLGAKTNLDSVLIDIRCLDLKTYVTIGKDSQISGNFVIENNNGQIHIGDRTFIGGGMFISNCGIRIGDDVMFSWGCTVIDNDAHSTQWEHRAKDVIDWKRGLDQDNIGAFKNWDSVNSAKITIDDKAWIGFNSIILKGVRIGEGAVVGAGSVVTKDVPPYTLVAGNPAQVIRSIK